MILDKDIKKCGGIFKTWRGQAQGRAIGRRALDPGAGPAVIRVLYDGPCQWDDADRGARRSGGA